MRNLRLRPSRAVSFAATLGIFVLLLGYDSFPLVTSPQVASAATLPACSTSGATGAGSPTYVVDVAAPVANSGDSSSEIQTAINTASEHSGGGQVVLQAGTYTIKKTIDVGSNVDLTGAGESSTTLIAGSSSNVDPMVTTQNQKNITVENMTVNQDGESRASKQSLSYYLIEARGGSNVIFQNVATREPTTYSMVAVSTSDFCFRNNNVEQDPGENGKFTQLDGIHILNSSNGDVLDNYVDNSYNGATDGDDGLVAHAYGGTVSNVTYAGNVVRGGKNGEGMGVWISSGTISKITVTDNEFWGEGGIHPGASNSLSNSSFTDNILHNNALGITLAGSNLTVTGNYLCSSGSVSVTGSGNTVSSNSSYTGCTDAPSTPSPPPAYPPQ
jgi:Pectate lyase superfamily protein